MAYSTNGNTFPVQKISKHKKTKAWVMYEKGTDGKTKILNVKQQNKEVPFKGVTQK
jgi:hypothetical protein